MRKITQTIVGTTPPLDKNVIWLDSTDNTAPVEKVFINGQWTPMGIDTDDYYTKEEVNDKLDEKLDVIETPVNGNLIAMDSQGQAIDSGKKTTDFIATPTDSGSEGEVLSVDSEGNPVWTTVTPTGTADTEMSNTSTNAVQNKVIKSYVDDNCAKKDGYYSTLTAGAAENLVGQTVDSEAYLIRPTGGTENEVANGVASVLGMEGNSAVWNQLLELSKKSGSNSTVDTRSNENAKIRLRNRVDSTVITEFYITSPQRKAFVETIPSGCTQIDLIRNGASSLFQIITALNVSSSHKFYFVVDFKTIDYQTVGGYTWDNVQAIDLTKLGIDNLTTVDEVEEWLAQHVGTKPYYAYNAGTILSSQTLGIKTYGQNLLNPTTRQAKLIPYTWVENGTTYSNQYTIKNVPSGATATFTPDATGVAVTVDISGGTLDITSYGSGILELSAATADTYVCIRWNGTKDDDVVPYEDHTYDFDVRKVYGKVSGAGEYIQCFPNGMRSAGSVHDILSASEAVVKVDKFVFSASPGSTQTAFATYYKPSNMRSNLSTNYLLSIGLKRINSGIASSLFSFSESQTSININIDGVGSHVAAAMNGQVIFYHLKDYITYTDLIYRDGGVDRPLADVLMNIEVNNWSMEEQLMTPYVDGNPTSIPATIRTQYGMDAVEAIDTLQKTCYFAEDVHANMQALLTCINTNCSETLGGTFGISETATDKVFEFTFTPNTEPDVEPTNEGE